jgi:hypothetical protein
VTLPQDDECEDESEDESDDEISDDDYDDNVSGEWVFESDEEEPEWGRRVSSLALPEGKGRTMELTRLLE